MDTDVIERYGQLAHHGYQGPPGIGFIMGLLGFVPRTHAALLNQPQDRKIEPLPRPRATALADPQLPLVGPAAAFHQVQAHRFAVRTSCMILPRVARTRPQDTGRWHAHHLPLGLEHRMSLGQGSSPKRVGNFGPFFSWTSR